MKKKLLAINVIAMTLVLAISGCQSKAIPHVSIDDLASSPRGHLGAKLEIRGYAKKVSEETRLQPYIYNDILTKTIKNGLAQQRVTTFQLYDSMSYGGEFVTIEDHTGYPTCQCLYIAAPKSRVPEGVLVIVRGKWSDSDGYHLHVSSVDKASKSQ